MYVHTPLNWVKNTLIPTNSLCASPDLERSRKELDGEFNLKMAHLRSVRLLPNQGTEMPALLA